MRAEPHKSQISRETLADHLGYYEEPASTEHRRQLCGSANMHRIHRFLHFDPISRASSFVGTLSVSCPASSLSLPKYFLFADASILLPRLIFPSVHFGAHLAWLFRIQ